MAAHNRPLIKILSRNHLHNLRADVSRRSQSVCRTVRRHQLSKLMWNTGEDQSSFYYLCEHKERFCCECCAKGIWFKTRYRCCYMKEQNATSATFPSLTHDWFHSGRIQGHTLMTQIDAYASTYIDASLLYWNKNPSIAQLVERRTVEEYVADILRSLVRIRFEGYFL